jgi:small subunit ribosomal protein S7
MVKKNTVRLFGKWKTKVELKDTGIKPYISLKPVAVPRSAGVHQKRRFHKSKINIVERLATHMMVSGHVGKKHKMTSGHMGGALQKTLVKIEKAFDIIEKQTKTNPIQVFVHAIENAALREEVTSYQVGSIIARSAVICAPQRRVDRTLRFFAQGTYQASFNKKKKPEQALAEELIAASKNDDKNSYAVRERIRIENEAEGSR